MVHIYVINLLDRKDRRDNVKYQMNLAGINPSTVTFVPAVDTRNIDYDTVRKRFPNVNVADLQAIKNGERSEHWQLTSGSLGCFSSHVKVWDMIRKSNEISLILEDDIEFKNIFRAKTILEKGFLEHKLKQCDIYLLGHSGFYKDHHLLRHLDYDDFPEDVIVDWWMGLHAYVLKPHTAEILYNEIGHPRKQCDWQLIDLLKQKHLKVLAAVHRLFKVTDIDSDIQLAQPCYKGWT